MVDDDFYMELALREAWKYQGLTYPNPAVGALLLDRSAKIVSIGAHKVQGGMHAELFVIYEAFKKISNDSYIENIKDTTLKYRYILKNHNGMFKDFTIYTTLEPCIHYGKTPSCAKLISEIGIKKVIVGCKDKTRGGGCEYLKSKNIAVKCDILGDSTKELTAPFFKWSKDRFIFFKMAQTQNGSIEGTHISSYESRVFVHNIRSKLDLIIIGGNTVRLDRPTLDSRLSTTKHSPDILIVSKKKEFDKSIPLFNVPNRKVFISNNFNMMMEYRYVMIEGGWNMLELSKSIVDRYLFFISPLFKSLSEIKLNINFNILNVFKNKRDIIVWSKILAKEN